MSLPSSPLSMLARSSRVQRLVAGLPAASGLVRGYVAGESTQEVVDATALLVRDGLTATLGLLREEATDQAQAQAALDAHLDLLAQLSAKGLARKAEISLDLRAIGQCLPDQDDRYDQADKVTLEHARTLCRAARNAGTTVTLDMEDHTTTDRTLTTLRELRKDFPETGAVLQAALHRTEADCREQAWEGARVGVWEGGHPEPTAVAFQSRIDIDKSFVRCLRVLLAGQGYPMIATHDPRMVAIASSLASRFGRAQGSYEYQMLFGVRPDEQQRLVDSGERVRVYIPYGPHWQGYLAQRLAARPQNLTLFAKSLVSRK